MQRWYSHEVGMVVLHYIAFIVIVEIKSFIKSLIAVWKVVAVVALLLVAVNILSVHLIASPLLDVSGECVSVRHLPNYSRVTI